MLPGTLIREKALGLARIGFDDEMSTESRIALAPHTPWAKRNYVYSMLEHIRHVFRQDLRRVWVQPLQMGARQSNKL